MKLISLNIWGGKIKSQLLEFIKLNSSNIDVFCLQEVYNDAVSERPLLSTMDLNIYSSLVQSLPNFLGYFDEIQDKEEGLAMFIKNKFEISLQQHEFVYRWKNAMTGNDARLFGRIAQYCKLPIKNKTINIINFHGLWNGLGKTDTEDRLLQTKNLISVITKLKGEKILCGDFNLLPDTTSIKMIEDTGMRNLIKEYNVQSTRSSLYTKSERFADYLFVSNGIAVRDFKVLPDEVSDHLPLYLEFEV